VIFSTRPWEEGDGPASNPATVGGTPVIRHLRTRRDVPGALLVLEDGRYAVTGPVAATGAAAQVQRYARRRLGQAAGDGEQAWWQEVIGALAR
jgi:cell volume regulation protein A